MAITLQQPGTSNIKTFEDPTINREKIARLLQGGFELAEGSVLPKGIDFSGGIKLPEAPSLPGVAGDVEPDPLAGITASLPSVDRADIEAQVKKQLAPSRVGIETRFGRRIAEAEEQALAEERALTGQLGVKRRFSSSAQAFIKFVDTENKKNIANLEIQMEESLANQDFQMAQLIEQRVANEYLQQQQTFENMFKILQYAEEREMRKTPKEPVSLGAVGDAVVDAIRDGKTTTLDIFEEIRKQGIDATPEEIEEITVSFIPQPSKDISKNAYEFAKDDVGKLIASGFTGEDIQTTQDIFNKYGLYVPIPELGDVALSEYLPPEQLKTMKEILYPPVEITGLEEGVIGDFSNMAQGLRVARMAFGSGRALSDKDRDFGVELYNKGAKEGLDVYQIVDRVFGFKIAEGANEPLAEGLRTLVLNIDGQKGMSDYDFEGLARLINNGKDMEAVRKIENQAMLKVRDLVGNTNLVVEADVTYINNKVKDITTLLGEGWANEVGAFTGTFGYWLSRKFGTGQAVSIKAKITSISADMVNKRAGANVTESEWERLVEPNVPNMNESADAWVAKMDELVSDVLERYNAERAMIQMPRLDINNIEIPETRVSLYEIKEDPNPLDLVGDNNPLGI